MLETKSTKTRSTTDASQIAEGISKMNTLEAARNNRIDLKTKILAVTAGIFAATLIGGTAMASYNAFDEGNTTPPAVAGQCNHVPQPYDPHDAEVQPEFGCGAETASLTLAFPVHMDESEILLAIGGEGAGKKGLALRLERVPMAYDPHDAGELTGGTVTSKTIIGSDFTALATFDESAIVALSEAGEGKVPGSGALGFPLPYDPFDADVVLGLRLPVDGRVAGVPALNYPVHMDESEILVALAIEGSSGSDRSVGRVVPQAWDPADSDQGN